MLAANHGQNRSRGAPLRSLSAMTLMPFRSIDAAVAVAVGRPAGPARRGPARCRTRADGPAAAPQPATYSSVTAVTPVPAPAAGSRSPAAAAARRSRPGRRRAGGSRPAITGRPVKYCTNPITPWASSTTSSTAARPGRRRRRLEPRSHEQGRHGQPDQQHHRVGVQLADRLRVEAGARTSTSPACGPLPVTTVPSASTAGGHPDQHPGQRDQARSTISSGPGPAAGTPPAIVVVIARITMDSRKCAATVHGLRPVSTVMPPSTACAGMPTNAATASRSAAAGAARPAAWPATAAEHEGQHPVGELDHAVLRVLGGRRERVGRAVRPGRAAEPGAGQPDHAAGDDDAGVGDHRRDRQPADQHVGGAGQLHRLSVGGAGPGRRARPHDPVTTRTGPGRPTVSPVPVPRPPRRRPSTPRRAPAAAGPFRGDRPLRRRPAAGLGCGRVRPPPAGRRWRRRRRPARPRTAGGVLLLPPWRRAPLLPVRPAGRLARGRRGGRDPGLRGRLGRCSCPRRRRPLCSGCSGSSAPAPARPRSSGTTTPASWPTSTAGSRRR